MTNEGAGASLGHSGFGHSSFICHSFVILVSLFGLSPMPLPAAIEPLEPRALFDATVSVGAPAVVNVSRRPGQQSEGTIAIDPANPARVFAASNESGVSLFGAASADGGLTWA